MTCPLCRQRKGKRSCPAKGASICSACCGAKRLVEIDCPPDCAYLTGAHAAGWAGRTRDLERDQRRLGPHVAELTERQIRLVLLGLAGVAALHRQHVELEDALVLDAVAALRKTVDTREKGILYEHKAADARADALVRELGGLFEARDAEGHVRRPADRDLGAALRALEGALRAAIAENDGPRSFLATAARLAGRLGAPSASARPLILEP
jgi:hypothetical protein